MAARPSAQHSRKKQVQSSIASFLRPTTPAIESLRPPSPPHETQAMLMSVGMRSGAHHTGNSPQSSFDLSSQGSTSTQSSFSGANTSRKRTYDEEAEEAMDLIFQAEEQSAKARPIAKGKARIQQPYDFEDAAFLQPVDDMDLG